jgi:broad specificity phosphatase PhoE
MHRWRGYVDVPITSGGKVKTERLGHRLRLDIVYHDALSRCRDTANLLHPTTTVETDGPRPWRMGPQFEGWPITRESLRHAQFLVNNNHICPVGGEPFWWWYRDWTDWIDRLHSGGLRVGVVTHNRNIQALYSRHGAVFSPRLYDRVGPEPLSVHVFSGGAVAPWGGRCTPPGIYLIRHAPTSFGT